MRIEAIKIQLEAVPGLVVSQRGSGRASFLYVRSPLRAVEVSEDEDGYFIEYWKVADEDSDADSIKKETVKSEADALAKIKYWLRDVENRTS